MMTFLRVILVLFLVQNTVAQSISGKVVDEKSKPIEAVNVYFDGTTIGTLTDKNGNFTLNFGAKLNSILVVNCLGYNPEYITNFKPNEFLNIKLNMSVNVLREVVVQRDGFPRAQKMEVFKKQFLGTTKHGKSTVIENEEDIYFAYDAKTKVLEAFADNPLRIINNSLGYKINYQLVKFDCKLYPWTTMPKAVRNCYYAGLTRFESISNLAKIKKKRNAVYDGSRLHFFRSVAANNWKNDGFRLFRKSWEVNPAAFFAVKDTLDFKKITVTTNKYQPAIVKILAEFDLLRKGDQSKIIFETDTFFVDKLGNNSHSDKIYFSGSMSEQKVGDMLPMDYGIN
ncbi:carboxypeptidase-like regulatory domain-containing protein [Flavobacterium sp. CHNK8]|uniref:carboxypeptidase-like regulatory domain-containing protein n=1 Tax=Flavobacterium sp. CHNK8 TaxID=2871165 RepID=UPI001C8E0A37|nr:carboxypeptidase-like regulatory domain-containing protein [Flavobacterium sp. CHNK8]QZK90460.1 carboxypeptidase-like regulatory domain-containing protein [Flavobacterium sp. CHNK8]